ncbi:hypothetical protein [Aquabacterium sp.]|uniref:hypothetical protein n=1 Tax=Aquabacterium sp. TaxID=1872578 RepID=UPI002C433606|nr:hypothetical protein [Aquabacterium sp.]HSW07417.1 hypothetical protein [Aquabacterium sp.]
MSADAVLLTDRAHSAAEPRRTRHATLAALRAALARHPVWFALPERGAEGLRGLLGLPLAERIEIHQHQQAACLSVDGLAPADLPLLRQATRHAWLAHADALPDAFDNTHLVDAVAAAGFKPFLSHSAAHQGSPHRQAGTAACGALEFLLSTPARLDAYPLLGSAAPAYRGGSTGSPVQAVFVLDLVQDFEIIKGQMARAAQPGAPMQACVAVTERMLRSHLWPLVEQFLQVHELPWFTPLSPADVAAALGSGKSLLITAAESSAPGHSFSHLACRSAPPRALRVTFQHGYECIGLRHHRAHDLQFPEGVRFASDLVFTWRTPDDLPNLHPADRGKCIAVGVTKAIAERAARLQELAWHDAAADMPLPGAGSGAGAGAGAGVGARSGADGEPALIVAENLHSVRFASPQRYQRFLDFIADTHAAIDWPIVVRSHPGKRTLERRQDGSAYRFLHGQLGAEHLQAGLGLVSPPSTIVLDAAMCTAPAVLWSDAAGLGDVENYRGLPVVTDAADLDPAFFNDSAGAGIAAHAWAVANTTALNGSAMAWQRLCQLVA